MKFNGPYIAESKIDRYIKIVSGFNLKNKRKSYYRKCIEQVLNNFDLPIPSHDFMNYASNGVLELVLHGIYHELVNSQFVDRARMDLISNAHKMIGARPYSSSTATYRLRAFGESGIYPNAGFYRSGARYSVINGQPFVLTKNLNNPEERYIGGGSENSVLSRKEVKIITSLMCVNGLIAKFSLLDDYDQSNVIEIQADLLNDVPEEKMTSFIIEYLSAIGSSKLKRYPSYDFTPSGWAEDEIARFYRTYRIDDLLLLRTSYLLIKASSMALNINYFEDAVSNIFVGIEGVLMILQRNDSKRYDSIDYVYQKTKFTALFNDNDQLYDFLFEEVFARGEKRATLVHPQAGTDWGWVPPISGEDYHDYRQILRCLIHYVVTDILYDPNEYR